MSRKILLGVLILGALSLIAVVVAIPIQAQARTAIEQEPQPASPSAPNALPVFEAELTGRKVEPSVNTTANGRALLVLEKDLSTLRYRVMVSEIADITEVNIHFGQPGENGDVVFPLYSGGGTFGPGSPISGTLTLSPNQLTELIVGNYYINVATTTHPTGEIRSQIRISNPPTQFSALLNGAQETPPVDTPAAGSATFTLNTSLDQLSYQIFVSEITSITLAHLHTGWPGQAGPPVVTLYDGSGAFDPSNPLSGTVEINGQNLLDLLTGYLYANVHTAAYPAGEIRGQVGSGYYAFEADLSGENEVPPVDTDATGRSVMVLSNDLSSLYWRLSVSDFITPTAAHIHIGAPGESGPIVFPLYSGSGPFDEAHPISGTITLTSTEQVNELLAGNYYVNVHTEAYPNGEIRGQLEQFTPDRRYYTRMTGEEEVPPVSTPAYGTAEFELSSGLDALHYNVRVYNFASDITAAHLHTGFPGQEGPPVIPLYSGSGRFDTDDPLRGIAALSPQNLLDLLTGYLYINVHTEDYPDGEIRGQLAPITRWEVFLPMVFKP